MRKRENGFWFYQYAELLAQQRRANFRSFPDETAALQWLRTAPSTMPARRLGERGWRPD